MGEQDNFEEMFKQIRTLPIETQIEIKDALLSEAVLSEAVLSEAVLSEAVLNEENEKDNN